MAFSTRDFTEMYRELYGLSLLQELRGPFPQKQGLGLKGLGWRFLTLTERALKE